MTGLNFQSGGQHGIKWREKYLKYVWEFSSYLDLEQMRNYFFSAILAEQLYNISYTKSGVSVPELCLKWYPFQTRLHTD